MKKIFLVIAAAAFLSGMTTSCVDMPETNGVAEVYSARAEFIKAQTALKAAEVKLKEAKVATENALTKQMEARAKAQEIQNQIAQTYNEHDKARLELELNRLKVDSDRDLVYIQKELTDAQNYYQWTLAQLEISKTSVPAQYQNELDGLKQRLNSVAVTIAYYQSRLLGYNLQLNTYLAKDSLQIVNQLTLNVSSYQRSLALATDNLNLAKAAKEASGPSLETTKAAVKTRLDAQNAEWKANSIKLNALGTESENAYVSYRKAIDQYNRVDYRADVAIPNVKAVKVDFIGYYNGLANHDNNKMASDTLTYSYIGDLDNLILQLQNVLSYVDGKVTANPAVPEWATLKASVKAKLDSFIKVRDDLQFQIDNLRMAYNIKNNEYGNLSNYNNSLNNSIAQLNGLYSTLNGNLSGLDQAIADAERIVAYAQADYNGAKFDLDAFKKNGAQNWGGWYNSRVKEIKDRITITTNIIAEKQAEFDMLTKQKDALVTVINNLGK